MFKATDTLNDWITYEGEIRLKLSKNKKNI